MNKKKLPVFILIIVLVLFSGKTFFGIGLENGIKNWRFYASLIGLTISVSFLLVFIKSIKKTN